MNIVFRVDSSYDIGGGHIKRCLSIANELLNYGVNSIFLCQDITGLDVSMLEKSKHTYSLIPFTNNLVEDAKNCKEIINKRNIIVDILIVDNYKIDFIWENLLGSCVKKLVVIDDLANKKHQCDLIINQVHGTYESDYKCLSIKPCKFLLGSKYMMIRKDFLRVRNRINPISFDKNITDIHVSFGLNDKDGLTIRFSKLILESFPELKLHIAIGNKFNYIKELDSLSKSSIKISWLKDTKNIEEQMAKCQIAIGSPGMITWERACLGLPSIQIGTSIEQVEIMNKLKSYEIFSWLGLASKLDDIIFIKEFRKFIENPLLLKNISQNCLGTVDGLGLERVCKELINL